MFRMTIGYFLCLFGVAGFFVRHVLGLFLNKGCFNLKIEKRRVGRVFVEREGLMVSFRVRE